jgi:hypothetical protein
MFYSMGMQKESLSTAKFWKGVVEGEVMIRMLCVSLKAGEERSMIMGQRAFAGPSVGVSVVSGRHTAEIRRDNLI